MCQTVAEMEGVKLTDAYKRVTQQEDPDKEAHKRVTIQEDPDKQARKANVRNVKYKIKTKYGEIPVYEKQDKAKKKGMLPSTSPSGPPSIGG